MSPLIMFALLAGLPFLLVMVLRIHASAFFISVSAGYLLSQFAGGTAGLIGSSVAKNSPDTTVLILFLVPILLTLWFMRKSMPSSQFILQFLPQLGSSLLVFTLIVPLLSVDMQSTVRSDSIANQLLGASDAIVAFAVALQLVLMIITARPPSPKKGKH